VSSSVARRFRCVDGQVREVTEGDRADVESVNITGRKLLPMSHNDIEGYSIGKSLSSPTPETIAEENEFCRKRNIKGVRFDPSHKHNCRITSNRGFAEYLKAKNLYNEDAGFNGF